jgi:hypothetical protein
MPIKGLDALTQKLNQLAKDAAALDGTHSVPLSEALTHSFLLEHSRFTSADDFLAASGFELESVEDFNAISRGNAGRLCPVRNLFYFLEGDVGCSNAALDKETSWASVELNTLSHPWRNRDVKLRPAPIPAIQD